MIFFRKSITSLMNISQHLDVYFYGKSLIQKIMLFIRFFSVVPFRISISMSLINNNQNRQEEEDLSEIVQLVGKASLAESDKITLEVRNSSFFLINLEKLFPWKALKILWRKCWRQKRIVDIIFREKQRKIFIENFESLIRNQCSCLK